MRRFKFTGSLGSVPYRLPSLYGNTRLALRWIYQKLREPELQNLHLLAPVSVEATGVGRIFGMKILTRNICIQASQANYLMHGSQEDGEQ